MSTRIFIKFQDILWFFGTLRLEIDFLEVHVVYFES